MSRPTPPMRNPLLIPELFSCILDAFETPSPDLQSDFLFTTRTHLEHLREARGALATLARTCRTLSEPSLDRLWYRLDSLTPLILSFSQTADRDRARVPPSPAEWNIFTRHSYRVRELRCHTDVDRLFLQSAARSSQAPLLFPNLKLLKWSYIPLLDPDLGVIMQRLLSPSIVSLATFVQRRHGIHAFLENYVRLCPQLKLKSARFIIYETNYWRNNAAQDKVNHLLSQAISTHEHLESLEVSIPINDVALIPVMLSPHLISVSLVLDPLKLKLEKIRFTSADVPFPNVKELKLQAWDLDFVASLLRPNAQMFRTFSVRLCGLNDEETISAFITTLASPQRMDSLQSIHLTYRPLRFSTDSHSNSVPCITYHTLRSLTSLKHLRELVLLLANEIPLSDEELTELARSWPMLEVLALNTNRGSYGASATLGGLLLLLMLCPRLRDLNLSLDTKEVPEKTREDVCNVLLKTVALPDSPIGDARAVADFLSRHLPSVKCINAGARSDPPLEEYESLWRQVNEYLREV